ncbi:TPA: recombinase family protein, partial [Streptococcus agalactiae]
YDKDENSRLVINPEQANVVKHIYNQFLDGFGPESIAKEFNAKGIKGWSGKANWYPSAILKMLQNEKYKGDALLQKTYTVDFLTKKRTENTGQVNQYYVANNHEAIISKELWETVQLEIARRKAFREEHKLVFYIMQSDDNPFTTKVFCAECGSAFGRKNWTTSRGKRKVWQCNNRYKVKGQIGCQNNHIDEEMLEKAFLKAVELLQEHRADVVVKWQKLEKGTNLLHKHYAKQMYQLLELDVFDGTIMNQVLDHIIISENGQISVKFLEGTEIDL